ncbi:MAG: GntR family transcriptional regulator [Hespellia sp.]|nr:GntR family transcriptional regulator [Hespellia sp.]
MEENKVPKYYHVKQEIIKKIDDNTYQEGDTIPSERELMVLFDVSRITIRKAIDDLVKEGYLYRVHGKGTFVRGEGKQNDLVSITSCTQDIEKLGYTPGRKVMKKCVIPADAKRKSFLNLNDHEDVFCLSRIYYADDEPINYTTTYLPYKYFPDIDLYDFAQVSLYKILEDKYDVRITKATRTIEAISAHGEIAEYLDVEEEVPLLQFCCTTYGMVNGKEVAIEYFKCYYRTDQFKFCIYQVR